MRAKLIITSENDMYLSKKDAISSLREAIKRISRQILINSSFFMNKKDYDDIMKWKSGK